MILRHGDDVHGDYPKAHTYTLSLAESDSVVRAIGNQKECAAQVSRRCCQDTPTG